MNTTVLKHHAPVVHIFAVKVQGHLSRAAKRRYLRRMQRDMGRSGLLMNYSGGFCMAVKECDANWRADRRIFVNWMLDQPDSREVVIATPVPLYPMLEGDFSLEDDFARLSLTEEKVSQWLISKVLSGLMTRAINRLQLDLGA